MEDLNWGGMFAKRVLGDIEVAKRVTESLSSSLDAIEGEIAKQWGDPSNPKVANVDLDRLTSSIEKSRQPYDGMKALVVGAVVRWREAQSRKVEGLSELGELLGKSEQNQVEAARGFLPPEHFEFSYIVRLTGRNEGELKRLSDKAAELFSKVDELVEKISPEQLRTRYQVGAESVPTLNKLAKGELVDFDNIPAEVLLNLHASPILSRRLQIRLKAAGEDDKGE